MEDILKYQNAGMTEKARKEREGYEGYEVDDCFTGYIPEDLDIWVPPKPNKIENLNLTLKNVILEGENDFARLVFFAPKDWVLTGKKSEWKTKLKDFGWVKKDVPYNLLDQFIRLADATPDLIYDFALKWGPLWRHTAYKGEIPEEYDLAPWFEWTREYRLKAKTIKSILRIAASLNLANPELASIEDWKKLYYVDEDYTNELVEASITPPPFDESAFINRFMNSIDFQRKELMTFINFEMLKHRIAFYLDYTDEGFELKIGSTLGFLSGVWFQLLQAVTKQNICLCDGCGRVYARTGRRPARGKRNYCEYCGTTASKRDYATRNRKK